jgi:hypothetical protein
METKQPMLNKTVYDERVCPRMLVYVHVSVTYLITSGGTLIAEH